MKSREAVVLRILELIENQNITINNLATISAVPSTTLKNIIYGNTENPGIVTVAKLCDGLGITLKDFFQRIFLMVWNRKLNKGSFNNWNIVLHSYRKEGGKWRTGYWGRK